MGKLYNKLKKYSIEDAIKFEEQDRQFLALKKLYQNWKIQDELYLLLIIVNALISFQLSWKWEDYWEEFWNTIHNSTLNSFIYLREGEVGEEEIKNMYNFFEDLLKNGKNNRRFVDMKLKRVEKFLNWFSFEKSEDLEYFYKNMDILAKDLAKVMNQKIDAKTIVFAVKMFSYWARNVFWYLQNFPGNLMIPIDSRLENLYKKYNWEWSKREIKNYYIELSKKLNISLLHLDAILWVNYVELIK